MRRGKPCHKACDKALRLLSRIFGRVHAYELLISATCWPMSDVVALRQARELVANPRYRRGRGGEAVVWRILGDVEDHMRRLMSEHRERTALEEP